MTHFDVVLLEITCCQYIVDILTKTDEVFLACEKSCQCGDVPLFQEEPQETIMKLVAETCGWEFGKHTQIRTIARCPYSFISECFMVVGHQYP